MLTIYLFSVILGGGLLLLSVLGGDGGDADLDFDAGLDAGIDTDFDGGGDAGSEPGASKIFSIRSAIYALFGFGATGSLLTWFSVGMVPTLAASVVTGLGAGALIGAVFSWLEKTDSGQHPGNDGLIGLTGRVTLPVTPSSAGTVIVSRGGGREIHLRALPHASGEGAPETWTQVIVVEIDPSGVARVAPFSPEELTSG